MKVILFMAISANGFIATTSGGEDFLSPVGWTNLIKYSRNTGCLVWGRKTYEAVIGWGGHYLTDLEGVKKVILSHQDINLINGYDLANSPQEALRLLQDNGFNQVIITGGATLNSEFARRGLIDEVILDVNPAILGQGIPLFLPSDFQLDLKLLKMTRLDQNVVELHYQVI